MMKSLWFLVYCCHAVLASDLYSPTSYAFPASTLVAPQPVSPLHYASPLRTSTGYGPLAIARVGHAPPSYYAPAPAVYSAPTAPILTRYSIPTSYRAPIAPVIPALQRYSAVPAVADIPITRYEAQPGFIQKYVDVAHPKVATTKIQIRRPAIQKQFYDIEERIVVRPIASAVVELDQPLSKSQAGPTLISPAAPAVPGLIPVAPSQLPPAPIYGPPQSSPPASVPQYPSAPENQQYPSSGPENPQFPPPSAPQNPQFPPPSAPQNPQFPPPSAPQNPQFPEISAPDNGQESDDSDSIVVENEDFRGRSSLQQQQQSRQSQPQAEQRNQQRNEESQSEQPEKPQARSGSAQTVPQQYMSQTEARFLTRSQISSNSFTNWPSLSRSNSGDVIPSSRTQLTEEQSQSNQQRLIELLTARGGVAEVRSGVSVDAAGEAGQIRGRVLSVTPAPPSSNPADERVSTRRIVVSRPIQTLQEVDVVQPFTKIHRLSVQHPAILKTPRVDIARVKTFAPVPVTTYGSYAPYTYLH